MNLRAFKKKLKVVGKFLLKIATTYSTFSKAIAI